MIGTTVEERAYCGPFFAFLVLLGLGSLVQSVFDGRAAWAVATPEYWLYPLQAGVCAVLLWHWRHWYTLLPLRLVGWTTFIGLVALAVWVVPQMVFHWSPRLVGFNPEHFGLGYPYAVNLSLRLLRAVVVVPLVEELFWRGFLLRYVVQPDFLKVPFGTYTRLSFWVVTAGFCLEHHWLDWPGAIITGMLYNLVAYRTKSLGSCVLVHAVTNFGLSLYILHTRQWGYW